MIRINLSPNRWEKGGVLGHGWVYAAIMLLALSLCFYIYYQRTENLDRLRRARAEKQAENRELVYSAGALDAMRKENTDIHRKIDFIVNLAHKKSAPILLLDQLSKALIPDKIFLSRLEMQGGKVVINGVATDRKVVDEYLQRLGESPHFGSVALVSTERGLVPSQWKDLQSPGPDADEDSKKKGSKEETASGSPTAKASSEDGMEFQITFSLKDRV